MGSLWGSAPERPAPLEMYLVWAQTRTHLARVERARETLRRAAGRGRLVVSTSWGKDSTALCALAVETLGQVPLLHLATPYSLPGYDEVVAHFEALTEVHTRPASRTLAEYVAWCREVGLPHERTRAQQSKAIGQLKRDPASEWVREHGYEVQALGMRADESRVRRGLLLGRGSTYQRRDGMIVSCPLAWWTSRDVWAFLLSRGTPYNRRIYDAETHGLTRETIRNTGWLSTDGAQDGRLLWLRQHFPEQWRLLLAEWPALSTLS